MTGHDCDQAYCSKCHRDRIRELKVQRDKWRGIADCREFDGFLGPTGQPECQGGDEIPSEPMCLTHQLRAADREIENERNLNTEALLRNANELDAAIDRAEKLEHTLTYKHWLLWIAAKAARDNYLRAEAAIERGVWMWKHFKPAFEGFNLLLNVQYRQAEAAKRDAKAQRARADLFQTGDFTLHSGEQSDWKIDCDALTDDDIATLAYLISKRIPFFGAVEGVPTGGLRLAEALEQYKSSGPLLIVDDVFTTGASIEAHRGDRPAVCFVIFARRLPPFWVKALFLCARP